MKKFIIKTAVVILIAFVAFFGGHSFVKATGDDKFCVSCHEWMDPMVKSYHNDVHGGNGKYGFKASCASCHLPHDSMVKYMFKKAANGVSEVAHMMSHDASKMDWEANRKRRGEYVFDSGCLSCHATIAQVQTSNKKADEMHKIYQKGVADANASMNCVSCHKGVGHSNLGQVLFDIKNPPVGEW